MRRIFFYSATLMVLSQSPVLADEALGHVTIPKGKYVMTNTETGGSLVVTVDAQGIMTGSKEKAAIAGGGAAAPAAAAAAVAPAAAAVAVPGAVAAPAAVGASKSSGLSNMLIEKATSEAKRQALKAVTGGEVNKMMKKVGADKYLH
jgi:hypothetical protein